MSCQLFASVDEKILFSDDEITFKKFLSSFFCMHFWIRFELVKVKEAA